MGFDSATAVDPMDYDFSAHVNGPGAKGTVPEPSQQDMRKYRKDSESVMKQLRELQKLDAEELSDEELDDLSKKVEDIEAKFDKLTARLCKDTPSAAVLSELPWRHKVLFSKWLQEQWSPKDLINGTKK